VLFHEVVSVARNVVQFQKGLSEPAFEQQYGTEEQCRAIVIASRWPHGFECPVCGADLQLAVSAPRVPVGHESKGSGNVISGSKRERVALLAPVRVPART
jgi:Transposase zinc-ribbon domain